MARPRLQFLEHCHFRRLSKKMSRFPQGSDDDHDHADHAGDAGDDHDHEVDAGGDQDHAGGASGDCDFYSAGC